MRERIPLLAWGIILATYLLTMSSVLGPADSPEFVALMELGGFAHPPGSPTTVLIYYAFSWLPLAPPLAASLVTAMIGAAACATTYAAIRAWGGQRWSAAGTMLLVGLHSQVWLIHTHPEAFAVNNLFAAFIVWLSAKEAPLNATVRVVTLGFLAGLGLGAHQSLVLLAPVGLYGVYVGVREARSAGLALLAGGFALAGGLAVYGTMALWDSPVSFGVIDGWDSLRAHFLREAYGTTSLSAQGSAGPLDQLGFWIVESLGDSGVAGFVLLLAGAVLGWRQRKLRPVVLGFLLAGPVFVAILNIQPDGPRAEMVKRFHALGFFVGAPLIALALEQAASAKIELRLKRFLAGAVLVLLFMTGTIRTHAVYSGTLEAVLRNTLESLPADAVIVGSGDHRYFGWQYLQTVEGLRPDVLAVGSELLGYDWYTARLRRATGLPVPDPGSRIKLAETLRVLLGTGRSVYVTHDFAPRVLEQFEVVPAGAAWRVLTPEESAPASDELYDTTVEAFASFRHPMNPPVYVRDPWGWSLYFTLRKVWLDVERRCVAEGSDCAALAREQLEKYPDL